MCQPLFKVTIFHIPLTTYELGCLKWVGISKILPWHTITTRISTWQHHGFGCKPSNSFWISLCFSSSLEICSWIPLEFLGNQVWQKVTKKGWINHNMTKNTTKLRPHRQRNISSRWQQLKNEMYNLSSWYGYCMCCLSILMKEILHLVCIKPCKWWDKLPTSTG